MCRFIMIFQVCPEHCLCRAYYSQFLRQCYPEYSIQYHINCYICLVQLEGMGIFLALCEYWVPFSIFLVFFLKLSLRQFTLTLELISIQTLFRYEQLALCKDLFSPVICVIISSHVFLSECSALFPQSRESPGLLSCLSLSCLSLRILSRKLVKTVFFFAFHFSENIIHYCLVS